MPSARVRYNFVLHTKSAVAAVACDKSELIKDLTLCALQYTLYRSTR